MTSHSRRRAKYPTFRQLNRNILGRARIDFGRPGKFKPKQLLPIQVASPLPHRPYLTSVLYQISTGFSDAWINFCVQDRHVVRQPFSLGCPACFEWPNGGACSEHRIEPEIVQPRNPCQTLATDAGSSKKSKGCAASSALIGQPQGLDRKSLACSERLLRATLRNIRIRCLR
jgi:hypothetical protein